MLVDWDLVPAFWGGRRGSTDGILAVVPRGFDQACTPSAIFPRMPIAGGRVRVLLPARREPVRARRGVDQVHGPQAPGPAAARLGVVHRVRRRARAPVHAQAHDARALAEPPGGWIEVGSGEQRSSFGPGARHAGSAARRAGSFAFSAGAPELRHLPREWLYRTRLPRTKLTSPAPDAVFDGALELAGERRIELDGWRGMVGHNWGCRARRALDLDARDRLRRGAATRGSTSPSGGSGSRAG